MNYLKKLLIVFLILTTIHLYLPNITLAGGNIILAKSDITEHAPESISSPEKDIPVETAETPGDSKSWKWLVIALLAIAGGVAIAGSGGDSSNNNSGSISVNW